MMYANFPMEYNNNNNNNSIARCYFLSFDIYVYQIMNPKSRISNSSLLEVIFQYSIYIYAIIIYVFMRIVHYIHSFRRKSLFYKIMHIISYRFMNQVSVWVIQVLGSYYYNICWCCLKKFKNSMKKYINVIFTSNYMLV